MDCTALNVLALSALAGACCFLPETLVAILSLLDYFFLLAMVFLGPLRVRALVFER